MNLFPEDTSQDLIGLPEECESGINTFWEQAGSVIIQKIGKHNLNNEDYKKLQERIKDQLWKTNVVFRMLKCVICNMHKQDGKELFSKVLEKLDLHYEYILLKFPEYPKYIENQSDRSDDFIKINRSVTHITDSIVAFCFAEARKIDGVAEVIDERVLYETFSQGTVDIVINEKKGTQLLPESSNIQRTFPGLRAKNREIEKLDAVCKEKFFQEDIEDGTITEEEAREKLDFIKLAFGLSVWKFQGIQRRSGEKYFLHLLEVAYITLNDEKASYEEVIIALLHDIIEDTNISYHTIRNLFGEQIALAVHCISKKSGLVYISEDNAREKQQKQAIINSGIVNNNLLLCDRISSILMNLNPNTIDVKKTRFSDIEFKILMETPLEVAEVRALEIYNLFHKQYKQASNEDYFDHYHSLETFTQYMVDESQKLGFSLSSEEIQDIAIKVLKVKLADRIHNLRTMWSDKVTTSIKKVAETVKHLLNISKEIGGELNEQIVKGIEKVLRTIQAALDNDSDFLYQKEKNLFLELEELYGKTIRSFEQEVGL